MPGASSRHLPFFVVEPFVQSDDSKGGGERGKLYVFRVKRRDAHVLGAIALLWFLWSQGGEIYILFSKFFESILQRASA